MTNCARAGGCAGSNYPFLTSKERDNETGLDYFGARYFASTQGRFTGADPYDINLERQNTSDPDEADDLFRNYLEQPQHWNHHSYALNNPLKYVDPDGLYEYETELLGRKIKVNIDDKIIKKDADALNRIKDNLQKAFDKINAGADKLTSEQVKAINSMNGIKVTNDIPYSHLNPESKVFNIRQTLAENPNLDKLTGDIIDDSFHADQKRRGVKFSGNDAEKAASAFTVDVIERIGGFSSDVIEIYKRDAKEGHSPPRPLPKSRPPKKKNP